MFKNWFKVSYTQTIWNPLFLLNEKDTSGQATDANTVSPLHVSEGWTF